MIRVPGWGRALLAGAVMACGLAPLSLPVVTLAALVWAGALFLRAGTGWQAARTGWLIGTGYFALSLHWIVEPFLVDLARHGWMAPFALVLMAGGLALFWGAAFGLAQRLGQHLGRGAGARILALIVLWTLAEFARAYLLTGFPWAALAQIWTQTPLLGLLAWVGPHGLAMATLAACLPLALIRLHVPRGLVLCLPALALGLVAGALWLTRAEPVLTGQTVRLIQPNAAQALKWHPDHVWGFFERQLELTAAAPEGATRPDLIVWPETSVPPFLEQAGPALDAVAGAAQGVPVVLGIRRRDERRFYNSLIYMDRTGAVTGRYDKHHLVPFGEYIPLGDLAARVGIHGLASGEGGGYSAGPGPALLDLGPLGHGLPLICYEAVFPQDVTAAPARPDLLIQITNDGWFGRWSGPYQHLEQARMRAVEQGVPMIRVANTGVSAVIGPQGQTIAALPLGQAGYLDVALPARAAATVYGRSGDWPVFLLTLSLLTGLWLWKTRSGYRQSQPNSH